MIPKVLQLLFTAAIYSVTAQGATVAPVQLDSKQATIKLLFIYIVIMFACMSALVQLDTQLVYTDPSPQIAQQFPVLYLFAN